MQSAAASGIRTALMFAGHSVTFPALAARREFAHRFTLRHPTMDVLAEKALVVERLWDWHRGHVADLGFAPTCLRTAEQVHGAGVAVVDDDSAPHTPEADALVTNTPGIMLGIYVADCCAVFLADTVTGAVGLAHSGKKGTEAGIAARALHVMSERFGSQTQNIIVVLSPCIRPPAYEVDFAADIRRQCLEAGVLPENLHDSGECTSADSRRFYSYRMEKGRTGRMLALLGRRPAASA